MVRLRVAVRSVVVRLFGEHPSLLDGSGRQPGDDVPLQEEEQQDHRDRADERACGERPPAAVEARQDVLRQPDCHRLGVLVAAEHHARDQELCLRRDERQQRDHGEYGRRQRQDDLEERLGVGATVDLRGFVERMGDRVEEALDEIRVHAERATEVDEDQPPGRPETDRRVEALDAGHEQEQRHHREQVREHLHEEEREHPAAATAEAQTAERECAECAEEHGPHRSHDADEHRVVEPSPERRVAFVAHQCAEVVERGIFRDDLLGVEVAGAERRGDHPDDREECECQRDEGEDVAPTGLAEPCPHRAAVAVELRGVGVVPRHLVDGGHRISSNDLVNRKLNAEIPATIMNTTNDSAAAKP